VDWTVLQQYRLEPEIYSLALLDDFGRHTRSEADSLPIHLKIDTGMSRLGFDELEIPAVLDRLRQWAHIQVRSVFSHLAAADDPAEDGFTERQVESFRRCCEKIARELGYQPLRHILNTAGMLRFPQYQFDMVRLGIGLFGVHPQGITQRGLTPAVGLKARVAQVRELAPGQTVGYSRKGRIDRPSRIAVVRIGYADGLLRKAGNGKYALRIRESPAPIVGNICMDMCMVDVTDIPAVKVGDEVQVFGPDCPIEQLAATLETIPYEILTNISPRVKRLYLQE
jgi:alanine racemase